MKKLLFLSMMVFIASGCGAKVVNVDISNDKGKAVLGLDYRDFSGAAQQMVQSLIGSGRLKKSDGNPYVISTGTIINDTTQRIDTRQLMAEIEENLMNSGQVVFTSAIGDSVDDMIYESRDLRQNDEFNQQTIASKGELIASKLNFSGKIYQKEVYYDRKTKQVEYYFQLIVTDVTNGLRFWQKQVKVIKRGSKKIPMW